jgi:phytoene synthase
MAVTPRAVTPAEGAADLSAAYEAGRTAHATHGRTYYLATLLLPPEKRRSVHALYGFARAADEVVDDLSSRATPAEKAAALTQLRTAPAGLALDDTLDRWDIPREHVDAFLAAMAADLTVTGYATWDDLMGYVHGSAEVIGLMMLPILEAVVPLEVAAPYAAELGTAFQLTNFLRDVGEDLARGRVYLPQEDLDRFGVTRADLAGPVTPAVRALLAFEVARTRALYANAWHGIRLLHPTSRPCVATAWTLYRGILDAIERADHDVLTRRVAVGPLRRAAVAGPGLFRALAARR